MEPRDFRAGLQRLASLPVEQARTGQASMKAACRHETFAGYNARRVSIAHSGVEVFVCESGSKL